MIWTFLAYFTASVAMGIVITAVIMWAVYKWIHTLKKSVGEYYYDVPRKPQEPKSIDVIDKVLYTIIRALLFLILFLIFMLGSLIYFEGSLVALEQVVKTMQDGINMLLPALLTVVVIFFTFKKPYYILFSTSDVIKRYQIYPCTLWAVITWAVGFGTFMSCAVLPLTADIPKICAYSASLIFQTVCFLLCIIVLINCCRIFLSDKSSELKILDKLYYNINNLDFYLQRVHTKNAPNLPVIEDYLIRQLMRRTKRAKRHIKKCLKQSTVEFWDASVKAPQCSWYQPILQSRHFVTIILSLGFGFVGGLLLTVGRTQQRIIQFLLENNRPITMLSLMTCCVAFILFAKCSSLCQMRRSWIYGRWGYRFLDEMDCPKYYIPRYPTYLLFPNRITKWFRALLNLLTLCRIECASGCSEGMLEKLHNILIELESHKDVKKFPVALAYYLCLRLAHEAQETDRNAQKTIKEKKNQILHSVPRKELFISWANAIWIDIKRDMDWYRANQLSNDVVQ